MTLTATSRPRRRSRARYTVAIPPWPISSMSSYFSSSGLRPESAVNRAPSVCARCHPSMVWGRGPKLGGGAPLNYALRDPRRGALQRARGRIPRRASARNLRERPEHLEVLGAPLDGFERCHDLTLGNVPANLDVKYIAPGFARNR